MDFLPKVGIKPCFSVSVLLPVRPLVFGSDEHERAQIIDAAEASNGRSF